MVFHRTSTLEIHRLLLNEIKTNCYVVQRGDEALLIDPTDQPEEICAFLKDRGLSLRYMIATHGHFDHVSAAAGVIDSGLVDRLYLHESDFKEIKRAGIYSLMLFKKKMRVPRVEMFDDEVLSLLRDWGLVLEHAGGHTRGSCFLYGQDKDFVITGDLVLHHKLNITLFDGRDNAEEFHRFIQHVETFFSADTVLLPGHGDATTLGVELEKNPKWAYIRKKVDHGH